MNNETIDAVLYDKIGQEITVGSFIVYGHALGRSAALRIGRVLSTSRKKSQYERDFSDRITIQGVDSEHYDFDKKGPQLLNKKSTLLFSDRVVVLPIDKVPDNVRNLF